MTEVWKGPWLQIRNLTDLNTSDVFGAKIYTGIVRPAILDTSADWKKEFNTPKASISGLDIKWIVENVDARQIEAGDWGLLTIDYSSVRENKGSGGGGAPNPDVPTNALLTEPTTWTLTWNTYTRSPIEYAGTTPDGTAADIKNCYEKEPCGSVAEASRYRSDIDETNLRYAYFMGDGEDRQLNLLAAEGGAGPQARKIYDYMCNGINVQFHAPVITKQDTF